MAALQYLRDKAGVFVAGLIGLSLFIFVVSDFFGGSRSQRIRQRKYYEIGQVNGEKIMYQDYEQRIQSLQEIYKLSGTSTFDETMIENMREQTWEQIIRERILDRKYEDLGIGVSTEELDELVFGANPHPVVTQLFTDRQTGIFNRSFLVNFLKSTETDETAKKYWLFFEDQIVNDRLNSKFNNLIGSGLYITSKQAEFENSLLSKSVDLSFMSRNFNTVPDSAVTITSKEINEYYEKHKEGYKRSAQRDIEYVTFDIAPSEDDFRQAEEWIKRIVEEFRNSTEPAQFVNTTSDTRHNGFYYPISEVPEALRDFVQKENRNEVFGPWLEDGSYKIARLIDSGDRPDSVHARHILISPSQVRTLSQARAIADSLVKLIRSGKSFADIARDNSDDQGSANLGGDLGWFKEGQMVVPFNNACFTGKKGEIITAETTFGVHIIEILDLSPKRRKYEVGIIERKVVPGSLTTQKIYAEASRFASMNSTYEKFNQTIAAEKLNKRIATAVTPQQKTLPGLTQPRYLIMALFQAEPGKIILDANQQAVFEISDKYVVAFCTRAVEEGPAPLKEVESDIRFALLKEKKAEKIGSELLSQVNAGKSLSEIAALSGTTVLEATGINFNSYMVQGAGIEPALVAAASVAEQGKIAGPVTGNNGVYLIEVNNVVASVEGDLKTLGDRLKMTYRMRGMYEAYEALRKASHIVDKRYKFY
ncbi:MAG TPA: peptidylprolyl isomerase [Bacteroidales bacterium]|nr:peptidylprolyl isomerase [Bacteroidales bacterium]HRT90411.1 peptidylprolyl isomerase [Bacteroidales bacterium]